MFYLRYLVLTFAVVLLEATIVERIAIGAVKPDLGLALVVYAGLAGGGRGGTISGFLVGLIRGTAQPEWLGVDALLLSLVAFAAAYTSPMVNRNHPLVQGGLIALLLLGYDLVRVLVVTSFALPRALLLWLSVSPAAALYTGLLAPLAVAILPRLLWGETRRAVS
jgi:rod shape-determining protein MreD